MTANPITRARRGTAIAATFALGLAGAILAVPVGASAATFTVTTTADAGAGSLREAISLAQSGDIVNFDAAVFSTPQSIALVSTIDVDHGVSIQGPGAELLTVSRANTDDFAQLAFTPESDNQSYSVSGISFTGIPGSRGPAIRAGKGTADFWPYDVTLSGISVSDESRSPDFAFPVGGAAYSQEGGFGDILIENSTFTDNDGTGDFGGAISLQGVDGDTTIRGSHFSGNHTDNVSGGAVHIDGPDDSAVTIEGSTFTENFADVAAGAVLVQRAGVVTVTSTTFDSNDSGGSGGALNVSNAAQLDVLGSEFRSNRAINGAGAALFVGLVGGPVGVADSLFIDNRAFYDGGAVSFATPIEGPTTFTRAQFTGNTTDTGYGGAIAATGIDNATLTLTASLFQNNSARLGGGALYLNDVLESDVPAISIDSSTFAGNVLTPSFLEAFSRGSSILVDGLQSGFRMTNSTVDDVAAPKTRHAIAFNSSTDNGLIEIAHSTIIGGGGVNVSEAFGPSPTVSHTIVQSVSDTLETLTLDDGGGGVAFQLSYSILSDAGNPGIADLEGNQFEVTDAGLGPLQDNGGPTPTRLPAIDSPAHNAGDPAITGAPATDQRLAGFARIVQTIDIGAVEIQADAAPAALPATGTAIAPLLPLGGALVILGLAAVVIRRRGLAAD